MSRFFPVLTLILALTGAILGWNAVPHYRTPTDSGEARLRDRAVQYYRATRLLDYLAMAQLYTPAKQIEEQENLLEESTKHLSSFGKLSESNKASLQVTADSITSASLEVELEGDWATTWGECVYPTENSQVTIPLDKMVWVKSGGDWWIYTWTNLEIAAYGNPPDDSYELLRKRKTEESRQLARELYQAEQEKVAVPGGEKANQDGASPQSESGAEPEDGK